MPDVCFGCRWRKWHPGRMGCPSTQNQSRFRCPCALPSWCLWQALCRRVGVWRRYGVPCCQVWPVSHFWSRPAKQSARPSRMSFGVQEIGGNLDAMLRGQKTFSSDRATEARGPALDLHARWPVLAATDKRGIDPRLDRAARRQLTHFGIRQPVATLTLRPLTPPACRGRAGGRSRLRGGRSSTL